MWINHPVFVDDVHGSVEIVFMSDETMDKEEQRKKLLKPIGFANRESK